MRWFPFIDLVLTAVAASLWYGAPDKFSWQPLLIALIPWAFRISLGAPPFRRTAFDLLILIFLLTAGMGVWASYDQTGAANKFWIILSSVFLFYSLAGQPRRDAWSLCGSLGVLSSIIALYFLLSNDWRIISADIGFFQEIGLIWMDLRPSLQLSGIHPNAIGGVIAILIPPLIAFGLYCRHLNRTSLVVLTLILGLITSLGFILTSSRGAWISLGAGLTLWVLWGVSRHLSRLISVSREKGYLLCLTVLVGLGSVAAFLSTVGGPVSLLSILPGPDATTSRLELFDQTLQLCRDYPFTGGGLKAFGGLYSEYIRVTPFFLFSYSHNLYLDVLLEQGIGGLLSLFIVLAGSFLLLRPTKSSEKDRRISAGISLFRWAAFTSLVTLVLHGVMDDALYGTLGTPLLFLLPGMAVAFSAKYGEPRSSSLRGRRWAVFLSVVTIVVIVITASLARTLHGIWYSNLGAVQMAKIELTHWPSNQWKEPINKADLQGAACLFRMALAKDKENFTAHYRLGLIAMLQTDFSVAATHLEAAHSRNSQHRGVVKSLGYCYVWMGQFDRAVSLLSEIPEARQEMEAYAHWWKIQGRGDLSLNATRFLTQ